MKRRVIRIRKKVTEIEGHEFKGFSAASVLGIEYYLPSFGIWGADVVIHYIDGRVMPSINLKYGINFDFSDVMAHDRFTIIRSVLVCVHLVPCLHLLLSVHAIVMGYMSLGLFV